MKRICLLGCTGSIGEQTIDIIDKNTNDFVLVSVSCGTRIAKLEQIISSHPSIIQVCVKSLDDAKKIKEKYPHLEVNYGDEGILDIIKESNPDLVVNALVGFVGFVPSVCTIEHDIDLALANKESLVVGGYIINDLLSKHKSHLYPIDSEHVALAKCLEGKDREDVRNLVITASGGSFRDYSREELEKMNITPEMALKHPSWSMGAKITVDSATMMNKGFEIIEAMHLFHFDESQIKVLLHDESTIHSLVEFKDHSFLADIGPADMRVPIAYALYGKNRHEVDTRSIDLEELGALHFRKFDIKRYPCVSYALEAMRVKGSLPCVVNASNEEAVYAFLAKKIGFLDIERIIRKMMDEIEVIQNPTVEDLINVDKLTRELTKKEIERRNLCK